MEMDVKRYAGINYNDFSAAPGVSLTFFTQGCPNRCFNCQNPETWDFDKGKPFEENLINEILEKLNANGIDRKFCIMGGEPLCKENLWLTWCLISAVKKKYPNKEIYVWTGYIYENLLKEDDLVLQKILNNIDYLIDGPYIDQLRDITLKMRGSSNQRIIKICKK